VKKYISYIAVAVVLFTILVLYMVTFTVQWKEKALVMTYGEIKGEAADPGLHWKWPWQEVEKFDGRIRTLQYKPEQMITRDEQSIIITVYVNWRINDARSFYKSFLVGGASGSEEVIFEAEERLRGWVSSAKNIFAEYNLGQMITLDTVSFQLDTLERGQDGQQDSLLKRLRESVATGGNYGIEIIDVGLRQFGVPDEVTPQVFERIKKGREAIVASSVSEGNSLAKSIMGEAESEATKIVAGAQARAKSIKGEGDAEAAEYYAEFLAHPELANFLRRLETLRITLSERATIVIDSDSPPYNLLKKGPQIDTEQK
jgi:membrane protease subunit HflC